MEDQKTKEIGMKESAEVQRKNYGKYDVEMAKIARDMERSADIRATIKAILKYCTMIALFICITICVCSVSGRLPESLEQLASVIREFGALPILNLVVILFLIFIIMCKNRRIKRLTALVGGMRHEIEHNDAANDRSGLLPDGTAVEDEKED